MISESQANDGQLMGGGVQSTIPGLWWALLVVGVFVLGLFPGLWVETTLAHSDVDPEIAKVTAELAEQPNNVELLLRRGQLHRYNGHYAESIDDLDRAWTLDRNNRLVALERCRTLVALGRTSEAEAGLTEYLQEEVGASRVMALVERAHLYAGTGRAQLAIADFSEALSFYPTIELYVARGHLQEELGQLDAAVAGYLVGLNRLPQASMLRSALIRVKNRTRPVSGGAHADRSRDSRRLGENGMVRASGGSPGCDGADGGRSKRIRSGPGGSQPHPCQTSHGS